MVAAEDQLGGFAGEIKGGGLIKPVAQGGRRAAVLIDPRAQNENGIGPGRFFTGNEIGPRRGKHAPLDKPKNRRAAKQQSGKPKEEFFIFFRHKKPPFRTDRRVGYADSA